MLEWIVIALVLLIDQGSKYLTDLDLTPLGSSVPLIEGVFHFTSAHNRGAAWGMMQGWRWIFVAMTLIVCTLLAVYLVKRRKQLHWIPRLILALVLGGAIGNLIDRIFLGYVRDMLHFALIDFPIFNVADSALCIGCGLLILNVFFMKENTFPEFLEQSEETKSAQEAIPVPESQIEEDGN